MREPRGLQGGDREAAGDGRKAQRQRQADDAAMRPDRQRNAERGAASAAHKAGSRSAVK